MKLLHTKLNFLDLSKKNRLNLSDSKNAAECYITSEINNLNHIASRK